MVNKKIIHVVLGKANPNRMNGVNRVVHFLADAQKTLGLNVEVWGLSANDELDETVQRNYDLKIFINGSSNLESIALLKAIKENKEAVFHLHGGFIRVFSRLAKEIRKNKAQYLFTPHGCFTKGALAQGSFKKKVFYWLYEKELIRKAKFVQCLGYQEKNDLESLVRKANIISIPNGQEPIEVEVRKKNEAKDHLVFGYCGRLDRHHKGLDLLMDGFIEFKNKSRSGTKLWIIGDGTYLNEMQNKLKGYDFEPDVTFFGKKFGDEKFQLIQQMDVFFHPSRHEGLPTAVLEACSLGVPSAVTPFTSFDRYIEKYNAGWRIADKTPKAVYTTMLQIEMDHNAGEIKRKSQNAENMIKNDFTWRNIAEALCQYYRY